MPYIVDGQRIETEKELREFAFNYTPQGKPFKQDFRLAKASYAEHPVQILETMDKMGMDAYEVFE